MGVKLYEYISRHSFRLTEKYRENLITVDLQIVSSNKKLDL
jgi:hypothetical protein